MEECIGPVRLKDLKEHLRITHDLQDDNLTLLLIAATDSVGRFIGWDELSDYCPSDVPYPVKAAILLTAGRLFENPTDGVSSLPTIAQNLLRDYRCLGKV